MKRMIRILILSLTTILLVSSLNADSKSGNLKVNVFGFESNDGKARILLFKKGQEEYYPSESKKAYKKVVVQIKNKKVVYTFKEIPFGDYAVSVHHDEDDNGKVNTNWIGIPNEPLGASNDAKGNFGPPSFDQAKISLNKKEISININLVN